MYILEKDQAGTKAEITKLSKYILRRQSPWEKKKKKKKKKSWALSTKNERESKAVS